MTATLCHRWPDAVDELQLIEQIQAGDESAREALVRQHAGRMLAVARRLLRSEEDGADAVQDALLSAFRALGSFAGQSRLGTWLHRIVVNTCLMKLRLQSRRREVRMDLLPTFRSWGEDAPAGLVRSETRARVRACIDRLPEAYRTVLLLRDIEELDTEETARRMGIAAGAVKTRLYRARQALRTLLEPLFADDEAAPASFAAKS